MSASPQARGSPQLVRRAIDLNYENKKRASSLRWSALNCGLLIIFAYDLSCKCPGYTSLLHYVELVVAAVLCANLLQHARWLLPLPRGAALTVTSTQRRLLGLSHTDLDSSFRVVEENELSTSRVGEVSRAGTGVGSGSASSSDELSESLSPRRAWRSAGDASPPSPPSPHYSPSPPAPARYRESRDEFIADSHSLSDYLRQYEERSRQSPTEGAGGPPRPPRPAPAYQLALSQKESGAQEGGGLEGAGGGVAGAGAGSPRVWWRLHLDPERLTQFNLNLRLWLQVTILARLVREMDELDAAFVKHGLSTLKIGEVSVERMRKLSSSGAGGAGGSLAALLPFLEPFPDQRYAVQRIRELARGGCLSEYRWCGGGTGWDDGKPTDSELVLALLAAYLDGQLPAPPARPFSTLHLSAAPGAPPSGPSALAIHRVASRPPHYALALGDETLEVARGRNNLLHTVLLFVAAAARERAPHVHRMHLGPAGLNMLWIIGR